MHPKCHFLPTKYLRGKWTEDPDTIHTTHAKLAASGLYFYFQYVSNTVNFTMAFFSGHKATNVNLSLGVKAQRLHSRVTIQLEEVLSFNHIHDYHFMVKRGRVSAFEACLCCLH